MCVTFYIQTYNFHLFINQIILRCHVPFGENICVIVRIILDFFLFRINFLSYIFLNFGYFIILNLKEIEDFLLFKKV